MILHPGATTKLEQPISVAASVTMVPQQVYWLIAYKIQTIKLIALHCISDAAVN